jgi:hypothetical protein
MTAVPDHTIIRDTLESFASLKEVDISQNEGPDYVVSFMTTFGEDSAYDVELNKSDTGFEAILLTSSETPLMRDRIDQIDENHVDSLFDHVVETIRELEGN